MTILRKCSGLLFILALTAFASAAIANPSPNKTDANTINNLIEALGSPDRDTRAHAVEQLSRIGVRAVPSLSQVTNDKGRSQWVRWGAVRALARIKAPESKPLLIELLMDEDSSIRGAASWGLSQIGGQDASDALLKFLQISWEKKNWSDLSSAAEAQKELPDKRAVLLLIASLEIRAKGAWHDSVVWEYVAEALGKIGDPAASETLAKQLDLSVDYAHSSDSWFLEAIAKTKGEKAIPYLVPYLTAVVEKMHGPEPVVTWGRKAREFMHNIGVYHLALSALEAITNRKSEGTTREEIAQNWKEWLEEREKHQAEQ